MIANKDSKGKVLSEKQKEFFKNTVCVNKNNELQVYYSSAKENHNFDCNRRAQFFSMSPEYSKEYNGTLYEVYLNIKNIFGKIGSKELKVIRDFKKYAKENNIEAIGFKDVRPNEYCPCSLIDTMYFYLRDNTDYDGIIIREYPEEDNHYLFKKYGVDGAISFVPFFTNQIKLVTNENPTNSIKLDEKLFKR